MKKLIIDNVVDINQPSTPESRLMWERVNKLPRFEEMCKANIVIIKNSTHFRCIKNRYGPQGDSDEKIPIAFLKPYLLLFVDKFTKEQLIDALI